MRFFVNHARVKLHKKPHNYKPLTIFPAIANVTIFQTVSNTLVTKICQQKNPPDGTNPVGGFNLSTEAGGKEKNRHSVPPYKLISALTLSWCFDIISLFNIR